MVACTARGVSRALLPSAPDLAGAYIDMIARTAESTGGFRKALGLDGLQKLFEASAIPQNRILERWEAEQLRVPIADLKPNATEEHTERMAGTLENVHATIAQLVQLTAANIAIAESQQESAKRTERFSRRATWVSIVIGGGSLIAAVATIVLSFVLRP